MGSIRLWPDTGPWFEISVGGGKATLPDLFIYLAPPEHRTSQEEGLAPLSLDLYFLMLISPPYPMAMVGFAASLAPIWLS